MAETIRARIRGGLIEPLEKNELPEGKEVLVTVVATLETGDREAFLRSAGSWQGLNDPDELIRSIYEDRLLTTRGAPQL